MTVAIVLDEVWLEMICLTNSEIAGSPRNISRYSPKVSVVGVEHWMDLPAAMSEIQSNSEYHYCIFRSQSDPAKRSGPEGNNPDHQLRSLNTD